MHTNLNKKQSVENLTKGLLKLRDAALALPSSENNPSTDEDPIMCDCGIGQGSNGAPLYLFPTLKDLNSKQYKDTHIHYGLFHKQLKSLNPFGKIFNYTHL